jgi:hypothetical protein
MKYQIKDQKNLKIQEEKDKRSHQYQGQIA